MESKIKAGVAILVSDKIDFKPTKIKRDKEWHYIMVKGSMQQEELSHIYNIYISYIKMHIFCILYMRIYIYTYIHI